MQYIYTSFILPKLMYASPAWSSFLTLSQEQQVETVQRRAFRVIIGLDYHTYDHALPTLSVSRLADRHQDALRKFDNSLFLHFRHHFLLPPDAPPPTRCTRHHNKLTPLSAPRTDRCQHSALPKIVINNDQHREPQSPKGLRRLKSRRKPLLVPFTSLPPSPPF